jgi:hypothetical protein
MCGAEAESRLFQIDHLAPNKKQKHQFVICFKCYTVAGNREY